MPSAIRTRAKTAAQTPQLVAVVPQLQAEIAMNSLDPEQPINQKRQEHHPHPKRMALKKPGPSPSGPRALPRLVPFKSELFGGTKEASHLDDRDTFRFQRMVSRQKRLKAASVVILQFQYKTKQH